MSCRPIVRSLGVLIMMFASGLVRRQPSSTKNIMTCYAFASHADNHRRRPISDSMRSTSNAYYKSTTHFRKAWNLRGGTSVPSSYSPPSVYRSASSIQSLHASTQQQDATAPSKSPTLAKRAQDCISIAGSSDEASLKSFGGLTYRDTYQESSEPYAVLFVLGGPGAGKGTQCDLLLQSYPCLHLSAGQLLRDESEKKDSEHAALIEECLVQGKIVPVEISLALLRNAMEEAEGQSMIFLIDGFPRNFDNVEGWTRVMANSDDGGVAAVWGVLVYECPLQVLEERVMERAKDSGRSDDNLDSLRRRFQTFQSDTMPVINTLKLVEKDTLLKVVDIAGEKPLDKVWEDTQKSMNIFIANFVLSANVRLLEAAAKKDIETYRSLCADDLFDATSSDGDDRKASSVPLTAEEIMTVQEGTEEFFPESIKCAEMTFVTGKHAVLTYDRTLASGSCFKETRVWSHQGSKGWRMVHFARVPNQ